MQTFGLTRCALAVAFAMAAWPLAAPAQDAAQPGTVMHSETMPLAATQALLLDIAEAASRAVAVGERGQILVSESRSEWRQVSGVPTRATLTAVSAVGDRVWAVGHDGTIVTSRDGGLTWATQRVDVLDTSPDAAFDPRQGVPLLDVLMLDEDHGFAVGAYAQLLRTDDGGASWTFVSVVGPDAGEEIGLDEEIDEQDPENDSWTLSDDDLLLDEESEPHFNAITRTGSGALFIVGERGAAYRSRDDGVTWERLQLPYGGSMFGVIGYENDHVVAFGMRGNAFESHDLGDTWEVIDTGTELSLMSGAAYGNGGFALVGANGAVVIRADATATPTVQIYANASHETPVLAGVLVRPNRSLVVSGEKGVDSYTPRARN
ncbi:hypothetical protein OS176_01675 [Xanthomonadaceae bacterium XH05]|nr:hypothetical protein [Xanthomonadaceae bacterium XH05]